MLKLILLFILCFSTLHANPLKNKCTNVVDGMLGLNSKYDKSRKERLTVCESVLIWSFVYKVDYSLSLAIAWHESRFTNQVDGPWKGPLQITTKYWCENERGVWSPNKADGYERSCDLISRGVFAIKFLSNQHGQGTDRMLCAYAGYKDCKDPRIKSYVKDVNKMRKKINQLLR
jgi:hypothetical protein